MKAARRLLLEILEDRTLLSTFTVDRLTDAGDGQGQSGDLRYCILNALSGDKISFAVTGTINLTQALPGLTKSISIEGPGPDQLTIRRDIGGNYRIFVVTPASTTISISGITITNGSVNGDGGGVFNQGTLSISNSDFANNSASVRGGAIYSIGKLTISDCAFSGNSTNGDGGAVYCGDALTVGHGMFSSNSSVGHGGAIYTEKNLTLSDSTFLRNSARAGGAIEALEYGLGTGTITSCVISDNQAQEVGGGIEARQLIISNSVISGNIADLRGGGIDGGYDVTIMDSTISGNRANSGGGIAGGAVLLRVTITQNTAMMGAGIAGGGSSLRGTIVAGNTSQQTGADIQGDINSLGHNLIGDVLGAFGFALTDLLNVDPLLGPLQDNGGGILTHALLPHSPAIDAGDNTNAPEFDQRGPGYPRIVGGTIDIGAFEVQIGAPTRFVLSAPSSVTAGVPFNVTLTAYDAYGHVATGYSGTVSFAGSDPYPGLLPADFTFTAADQGVHTFADLTFFTAGLQTLTAQDTANSGLTGSTAIAVTAAPASQFLVMAPPTTTSGMAFDVTVTAVDAFGNTDLNYLGVITFSTTDSNPGVILPADYSFQASDSGTHIFVGGITLVTAGDQSLTITDTTRGITGSATITVVGGGFAVPGGPRRDTAAIDDCFAFLAKIPLMKEDFPCFSSAVRR